MIGVTDSVGAQDADIKAFLLFYDLMVPFGKADVKIEAGNDVAAAVDKTGTHTISSLQSVFGFGFMIPLSPLFFYLPVGTELFFIKPGGCAAAAP